MNQSPYSPVCGKVSHPSRRVALWALKRVLSGQDADARDRDTLDVYRCSVCGGYHLGNTQVRRPSVARRARHSTEGTDE